jgi:transcriptional regulator GlxA family with amidase domain
MAPASRRGSAPIAKARATPTAIIIARFVPYPDQLYPVCVSYQGDSPVEYPSEENPHAGPRSARTWPPRRVVSGTRGLALEATAHLDPARPGIVLVPGAAGSIAADPDEIDTIPVLLARVGETALPGLVARALAEPGVTVAAVCGGSLALAMAGLLEGRHVVTHEQGMDMLGATGARAVDARVVDDGDLVTAAGVTSGLDLGLHLVERLAGPRVARAVERLFQYEQRGIVWRASGLEPVAV